MHPLQTHHLLFAYFCSIHLSFLDTNGATIFPLLGIIKEHFSHQDCQFMHIQPRLEHKVTRVICQGHKHIHALTNLKQERSEGRFPSGTNTWCMNVKVHTPEVAPEEGALEESMSQVWWWPLDMMTCLLHKEVHLKLSLRLGNEGQMCKQTFWQKSADVCLSQY